MNGVMDALKRARQLAILAHKQEGGRVIIPGPGRLCDEHDVLEYSDTVTIEVGRLHKRIRPALWGGAVDDRHVY